MASRSTRLASILAAVLLSSLTLGVFYVLQYYGPESALRKFHRAAVNRDVDELLSVIADDSYRENVQFLGSMVENYARIGARYQVYKVDRGNRRVVAEVGYVLPNRQLTPPILWIVEKKRGGWKVDVNETVDIMQRKMFGP